MPFIDSKISVPVSKEKKDAIKSRLGQAVSILSKPESYLMVGFDDDYDLYFAGERVERGAYVSVSLFGDTNPSACDRMTGEICRIYGEELDIPADRIYVSYHGVHEWGWNGRNF